MSILWRCAVVSLVVALIAPAFTIELAGGFEHWWDRLLIPFRGPDYAWFWLQNVAAMFAAVLAASGLSAAWVFRARTASGGGP